MKLTEEQNNLIKEVKKIMAEKNKEMRAAKKLLDKVISLQLKVKSHVDDIQSELDCIDGVLAGLRYQDSEVLYNGYSVKDLGISKELHGRINQQLKSFNDPYDD